MNFSPLGIAFISILLLGCATHQNQNSQNRADPLERFNRSMFNFNYNILDPYVVKPAAIAWRYYIPKPARNGLHNFFMNIEELSTMVNYFMEKKPYKAMIHFNRFFLNTLLGMGGFIDVAAMTNPKLAREEPRHFGSTLGNYGIDYGPYMQLPGYGSFTPREDIGRLVDYLYPLLINLAWWIYTSKWVLEGLETRAQLLDSDSLLQNSQDPYVIVRNAYFQRHDFLASDRILSPQLNLNTKMIQDNLDTIDKQ